MSKILNRYIKKYIILNISIIFLILISLSIIIKLFEELKSFEKNSYSIFEVFLCVILSLPKDFELFFPISILLGGLLGLSVLESQNELLTMQIFGLSKFQISLSVIKASTLILLLNIVSNEWILPYSQQIIYSYRNIYQYNTYLFPEKNKNLWLIDNNNYISIEYMLTTKELLGLNLFYFTEDKKLKKILYAERAIYINKIWHLSNITELNFSNKIYIINKKNLNYIWITTITPNILSVMTIHPRVLSMSKLMYCIKYFNKIGQNSKYYQLIFWNKFFSPITGLIMISMALLYNFGPFYHKKISIRLFFGSMIGFLFYILHQVSGSVSMLYNIPPLIGSVTSILLLIIINMIFLWKYFQYINNHHN